MADTLHITKHRKQLSFNWVAIKFRINTPLPCKLKASEEEAFRIYELNLLAFVLNKFDFWGPKCPNYLNIEF